jgi:hypothetical protein
MSTSALRDVVARLATEPALAAELDADPDAFGRTHRLTVDEVATLRALRRPGTTAGGPVRLRERLSRSGMGFGGTLGALADDVDLDAPEPEDPPADEPVENDVDDGQPEPVEDSEADREPPTDEAEAVPATEPPTGEEPVTETGGAETPAETDGETDAETDGETDAETGTEIEGEADAAVGAAADAATSHSEPAPTAPLRPEEADDFPPPPEGPALREEPNGELVLRYYEDPDGAEIVVTTHPDGRTDTRYPDGSIVFRNADGSSQQVRSDGTAVFRGADGAVDQVQYPDGTTTGRRDGFRFVRRWEPDGTSRYEAYGPDGTLGRTHHSRVVDGVFQDLGAPPTTGVRTELPPPPAGDPVEIVSDRDGATTTYADGTSIRADARGNVTTTYPDGTTVHRSADGTAVSRRPNPDGSVRVIHRDPSGQIVPGGEFDEWPPGRAARPGAFGELPPTPGGVPTDVTIGPDGVITRTYPGATVRSGADGSVHADYGPGGVVERAPDGVVRHHRANGEVLTVRPDGSSLLGTPRADGTTFLVVPRDAQGRAGEPFVGRPDGHGGYTPVEQEARRDHPEETPDERRREPFEPERRRAAAGPAAPAPAPAPAPQGVAPEPAPAQAELPPGATVIDLPGGGQVIRYADGATSTVTPNPDGSVHVVERDAAGNVVDTFDTTPDPDPADDEPVSLLEGGAVTAAAVAVAGAAVAAALRARRRG